MASLTAYAASVLELAHQIPFSTNFLLMLKGQTYFFFLFSEVLHISLACRNRMWIPVISKAVPMANILTKESKMIMSKTKNLRHHNLMAR